jgi:A/G-specific adenine glycosylase
MHPISSTLIQWYKINKRDLPWRNTTDPYKIWLSEIILQQTQVIQGLSYYLKFVEHFPTVKDLAKAPEDLVMRLWQGLGYYSRARNLHAAAKHIQEVHSGVFPKAYDDIKSLKGVGDYTAAAIASFAYQLPHAVVDGNVYRVLSRLFDCHTLINSSQGKKEFQAIADELLHIKKPDVHNSAIMEFGALFCKPQNPRCDECPLQSYCLAFQNQTVSLLPVKNNTLKVKTRFFNYIILNDKDSVYITKRTEKDIWQNLYEFYLIESLKPLDLEIVLANENLKKITKAFVFKKETKVSKHILSHQHIHAVFYELDVEGKITDKRFKKVKRTELTSYGFPQLINKYLELAG